MDMCKNKLGLIAAATMAITSISQAATYHLNFGGPSTFTGTAGIDSPAEAAGAVTNATFNAVGVVGASATSSQSALGLTLDWGTGTAGTAATRATINYSKNIKYLLNRGASPLNPANAFFDNTDILKNQVVRDLSADGDAALGLKISGLALGEYDFYLTAFRGDSVTNAGYDYRVKGAASSSDVTDFSTYTAKTIVNNTPTTVSAFIENDNYVKLTLTVDATNPNAYLWVHGYRDPAVGGSNDYIGVINSLEIVPVPEPTSVALLSLGGLLIGRRRR